MDTSELPGVIDTYQRAHDRRDTDTALATFSADATVIDDGNSYVGADQIGSWLDNVASGYTYIRTVTGIDDLGDGVHVVHNHLSGNFPGGEVDLHYRFALSDGLITHLTIGLPT